MRSVFIALTMLVLSFGYAEAKSHHHHRHHHQIVQGYQQPPILPWLQPSVTWFPPQSIQQAERRVVQHNRRTAENAPVRSRTATAEHKAKPRHIARGGATKEQPVVDKPKPVEEVEHAIGNVLGMSNVFVAKLRTAFAAIDSGSCKVGSGFRSHAEQARLYRQRPRLAAPPGHSNHERGLAADLSCRGHGLAWMHAHAHQYGLRFPIRYEAWHIEPAGVTRIASRHHHHHAHYASGA